MPEKKEKGKRIIKLVNFMGGGWKGGHNRKGLIEAYRVLQKLGGMNIRAPTL